MQQHTQGGGSYFILGSTAGLDTDGQQQRQCYK